MGLKSLMGLRVSSNLFPIPLFPPIAYSRYLVDNQYINLLLAVNQVHGTMVQFTSIGYSNDPGPTLSSIAEPARCAATGVLNCALHCQSFWNKSITFAGLHHAHHIAFSNDSRLLPLGNFPVHSTPRKSSPHALHCEPVNNLIWVPRRVL